MNNQLKPQDLRIGNYVNYNSMNLPISGIRSPKPLNDKRFADKWLIELFDGASTIDCTIEDINPIPLTEEIILMAGFNNNGLYLQKEINKHFTFKLIPPKHKDDPFHFMPYASIPWGVDLYEVNQLQNLFHSLTGEELEINLK